MRLLWLWTTATLCILIAANALARNEYLEWWSEEYPDSSADDSLCQLCHERAGGGNGWNRYGWSIRSAYFFNLASTGNPEVALKQSLQDISSISDGSTSTYIAEINANTQPGWRIGEVNVIRFVDESSAVISILSFQTQILIQVRPVHCTVRAESAIYFNILKLENFIYSRF